jgi:hypothetical protein
MDYTDEMGVQLAVEVIEDIPPEAVEATAAATAEQKTHMLAPALYSNHHLSSVLQVEPTLQASMLACLSAAKSKGTVKNYSATVRRFESFCHLHGHQYPYFTSEAITQFILQQDVRQTGAAFICTIRPALTYLEKAMNRPTAITPTIGLILEGAKRRARARAGPVKKAQPLEPEDLATILLAVFPPEDTIGLADTVEMRTAFRSMIEYHTLCRFDCFSHLQAKHFELIKDDIMITFPMAKNDQLHQGQQTCLAAAPGSDLCPVRITKLYFRRFFLRFGEKENDSSFVNFQLRHQTMRLVPILNKSICRTTATSDLRKLCAKHGISGADKVTDKTVKVTGVTQAFTLGASETEVCHGGRWKTSAIPLRYKLNTYNFKKTIALKFPPLQ